MMRRLLGSVGVATVVAASMTPGSRAQAPIKKKAAAEAAMKKGSN